MPLIAAQCYPFAIQIRPIQPIYDSFMTHMGGILQAGNRDRDPATKQAGTAEISYQ